MDHLEECEATQVLSGGEDEPEVGVLVGGSGEEGDREREERGESGACERESGDRGESEMGERQTAVNVGKESSKAAKARERQRLELMRENQRLIRENQSIDVGFSGRRRFRNPAEVAALLKQKRRSCGTVGSGEPVPGPVAMPVVDLDADADEDEDEDTCGGDVPPLRQRLEMGGPQDLLPPPRPAIHDPQLPREQKSKLTLEQFLRQKIGSGQEQQFVELQPSAAITAQKDAAQQLRDRLKRSLMHRYLPTGPHKHSGSQPAEVRCVRTAGEIDPILSRGVELILGDEERARFTDMTPRDKWNRHRQLVLAAAIQKSAVAREAQLERVEAELADTEREDGEHGDTGHREEDDDPEWTTEGAARGSGGDASDTGDTDTASDSDSDSGSGDSGSDVGEGEHTRQPDGDASGSEEDSFGDVTKKPVPARMRIESDSDSGGDDAPLAGCVEAGSGAVALAPGMSSAGGGGSSSPGTETAVAVAHESAVSELSVKVSPNDTGSDLFPDFNNSGTWRDLSSTGTVSMSSVIADKSGCSRSLSASVVSGEMRLNHRHMFDFSSVQGRHNASVEDQEQHSEAGHGHGHGSLLADTVDIDDCASVDEASDAEENKDEQAEEEQEEEEEEEELVDEDEEEDQRQRLAAAREMFDEEAELSGSDADQYEDEDETGMDGLDGDEDDLDQEKLPSAGRLRRQIERVHNRLELDRDARDIRYLQELYLEDGELHEYGDQPRRRAWFNDGNNNEGNDKFSEYQVRYRDLYDDNAGDDDDADADESVAIDQDASDDAAVPVEDGEDQLKENNRNSININYCKSAPAVSSVAASMTLEEYMKKLKSEKRSIKRVSLIGKDLPDVSRQLAETCGTSGGFQTLRSRVEQRVFSIIPRSKASGDAAARKRAGDQAGAAPPVAERQSGTSVKRVRPDNARQ